ncbi:MAG: NAD(P)/FAD-dependent oxidoreductase [Candidatus Dormiibacterota bacterium]
MRRFDVVILGGGSGAEAVWGAGLAERSVAVIEELRFGGECPFLACMPSKAMLDSASRHLGSGAEGQAQRPGEAYRKATERRDRIAEHRDDSQHLHQLQERGVEAIRGRGRVLEPGLLEVNGERIAAEDVVIATGSMPNLPNLPGLDQVDYWLSDRVLSTSELPESAVILGGGPVGCELAQVLARYGCRTCLIEVAPGLLVEEEPELGRALSETLRLDGVEVLVGLPIESVEPLGNGGVLVRRQGEQPRKAQVLVVATGRRPRVRGLGLEAYGLASDAERMDVDEHCRALGQEHLFGVGDVTGVAPFTHTAKYQGEVAASNIKGGTAVADYRAIPRVIYTDPPVAAVGLTRKKAEGGKLSIASATFSIAQTARALAGGVSRGEVVLVADQAGQVLVGAALACPGADEAIGWATLAVKARLPLTLLRDTVVPFPTYSEAYLAALDSLIGG